MHHLKYNSCKSLPKEQSKVQWKIKNACLAHVGNVSVEKKAKCVLLTAWLYGAEKMVFSVNTCII